MNFQVLCWPAILIAAPLTFLLRLGADIYYRTHCALAPRIGAGYPTRYPPCESVPAILPRASAHEPRLYLDPDSLLCLPRSGSGVRAELSARRFAIAHRAGWTAGGPAAHRH